MTLLFYDRIKRKTSAYMTFAHYTIKSHGLANKNLVTVEK